MVRQSIRVFLLIVVTMLLACARPTSVRTAIRQTALRADPALILPPPAALSKGTKRQAIMIYFPGNGIPPSAYEELVHAIQDDVAPRMALTGVILHYPRLWGVVDIPAFFGGAELIEEAIAAAKLSGPFDVFLAGHSLGGILAQELLKNERLPYPAKVVLHASYLVHARVRQHFYRSTLTLLGDRDGVNRLTVVPALYSDAQLRENVVVLREINHRSFCNGSSTANVARHDLECTTARAAATATIARATSAFLLRDAPVRSSLEALVPFAQALARDRQGRTCAAAQHQLTNATKITVQTHFRHQLPSFLLAEPSHQTATDAFEIVSFSNEPVLNSVLRISSFPQAVDTLRCKLLTTGEAKPHSCQAMNEMIFEQALSAVPDAMQAHYRTIKPLAFESDALERLEIMWALGKLQWKDQVVTSPAFRSLDKVYCTILSASQAMEYIMIDSQQET